MLICDSESDGFKFESTKIWVICAYDTSTDRWYFSFDESVYNDFDVVELLTGHSIAIYNAICDSHGAMTEGMAYESVCFHNYFQHDKPLIKKFYPWFEPKEEHDSYILSQLFNPDRGKHGLDAWGQRFGIPKPEHEEWDKFSPEMLHRVIEDVRINVKVWEALMKEKQEWEDQGGSWDEAIRIEYGIADLQGNQEMHGLMLDIPKAYDLADEIYQEIQKIDTALLEQMPMRVIRGSEVSKPFKKDRTLTKIVENWYA
jgi:hypothetical protein